MPDVLEGLKETRAAGIAELRKMLDGATGGKLSAEQATAYAAKEADLNEVIASIERFEQQDAREQRAAASRAATGDAGAANGNAGGGSVTVTSEPMVYGEGSGHSYFLDEARRTLGRGDGDGGVKAAVERMARHEAELRVEMPRRMEARRREAERRMESMLSGDGRLNDPNRRRRSLARREKRLYERFQAEGMRIFEGAQAGREQRFISRTDGQGGYFVPPLWLIDEYIPYLRAGRTFADLWRNFPLPSGTDSINLPRVTLGTATGPQPGDGAPVPGRDITDSFVNARVMTVAGQQDAAIQLLDQSPIAFDEIIFGDLAADYNMQLSAQLMLGSGFPQLNGLFPTGVLYGSAIGTTGPTTYGFYTEASATTTSMWSAPQGTSGSFYQAGAQMLSQIARNRFMPVTQLISNPMAWYALASASDTTGRPLVVPAQQGTPFNELAYDNDGPVAEGPVGRLLGVGWQVDPNIPYTFGGTGATQPTIGTISNGSTAAVPGTGGTGNNVNSYTPLIAAVWPDLYLWEGEIRSRTLSEVLSGTLQVRFQLYAYAASMANRYQNSSSQAISYGNVNSVGVPGAALSQGSGGGLVGF
jgi:HK97 family phage major capsid protein